MHVVPLVEYLPTTQSMQSPLEVEPAAEDFPASHPSHVFSKDAPRVSENFPAAQSVQTVSEVAPFVFEYVPWAQFVHEALPAPEYLPATHDVHEALDV